METAPVGNGQGTLVVLLHAFNHQAYRLVSVEQAIKEQWPAATLFRPQLPLGLMSMRDANEVTAELLTHIDRLVEQGEARSQPIENIVLVGHSLGGLLARKLYIVACGEVAEAPLESAFRCGDAFPIPARPWANKVSRVVLLAGMNRGWNVSSHLSLPNLFTWWLGDIFGQFLHAFTRRWPLIFAVRKGAVFITQLRIQWLHMRRRAEIDGAAGNALTVQLLGSRDDMVAPEDNVDLVSGGDFIYLDVPYSGHADVIDMDDVLYGAERKNTFQLAVHGSPETLRQHAVVPSDETFSAPDLSVKNVVFVIHGIRDVGFWTHKIARRVKQRAGDQRHEWATETSSYGYFPMLPFLFPAYRRQKVEWLMDQYAEALARFPTASFSYVGHSNGTYLLAKALEIYPCCYFKHVVFAGSVVNRKYNWRRFIDAEPARVKAVLNFVATSDWVVAFFPKLFQWPRIQDLGSAGHDGFVLSRPGDGEYQVNYVRGGHSAAIQEPVWDLIADFVIHGEAPLDQVPGVEKTRNRWVTLLGRFPLIVWAAIGVAAWGLWQGIQAGLEALLVSPTQVAFATGVAASCYALVIWLTVTRL